MKDMNSLEGFSLLIIITIHKLRVTNNSLEKCYNFRENQYRILRLGRSFKYGVTALSVQRKLLTFEFLPLQATVSFSHMPILCCKYVTIIWLTLQLQLSAGIRPDGFHANIICIAIGTASLSRKMQFYTMF